MNPCLIRVSGVRSLSQNEKAVLPGTTFSGCTVAISVCRAVCMAEIFLDIRYAEPTILGSLFLSMQSIPQKYRKVNRTVHCLSTVRQYLTLPMPKGRGFLVRRPLRRLRGIGVLHDLPKREFPCAPRYVLFSFMQLWICLPKLCAGCSLRHSHLCHDGIRMRGNPIRGRSNPL